MDVSGLFSETLDARFNNRRIEIDSERRRVLVVSGKTALNLLVRFVRDSIHTLLEHAAGIFRFFLEAFETGGSDRRVGVRGFRRPPRQGERRNRQSGDGDGN